MQIVIKQESKAESAKAGDCFLINGDPSILAQLSYIGFPNFVGYDFISLADGNRRFGAMPSIDILLKRARSGYHVERLEKIVTE